MLPIALYISLLTPPFAVLGASPSDLIPRDYPSSLISRDVVQSLTDYFNGLASNISQSDIIQGILPNYFQNLPSVDSIESKLGLNATDIDKLPLEVLNIPGYANYTTRGWNLLIHGQAYRQPLSGNIVSNKTLDAAANAFLPDFDIDQLSSHEQDNARNLTSAMLSLPQEGARLMFSLEVAAGQNVSSGWKGEVTWSIPTDARGEIDGFVQLPDGEGALPPGNTTTQITRLDIHTNGTDTGNATGYLVPDEGITIVSDIDDVLRITKIYEPKEGLLNTFARDMVPWLNMPSIYTTWSRQHPERPYHFHYLTTTPEQATRVYMQFIYHTYPLGSFDTRPLNLTTVSQTFSIRKTLLTKIFLTFPHRRFVLVGDTTNNDVMNDYPEMAATFPSQVACILLRNTTATDSGDHFPYDTSRFEQLKQEQYMFFTTPDDLVGLDFGNGDCRNTSAVMGTVEFRWQGVLSALSAAGRRAPWDGWLAVVLVAVVVLV